jgi:hypothetical protein
LRTNEQEKKEEKGESSTWWAKQELGFEGPVVDRADEDEDEDEDEDDAAAEGSRREDLKP